ncbi:hypothetical protein Pyrfu_0190 [Pyrolobus fumarii 1A]|uniref:Uncharacterized protein n=1 Tax=Pyrolobus fumarii (strain DSM 11204 / 1A) TaxID=694429 RepID=G0EEU8_PYRF1|nr:hypothetical protein [Pyrolobus fumarii]AEM38062.1 hypothetical protein Pyrfu_0190 [Pyrolobus fumarii 1A]
MRIVVECERLLNMVNERSPLLVYGEAASGKTLMSLAIIKQLYTRGAINDILLVTSEPVSTLPAASRILPPRAKILTAFSTLDILEYLLEYALELAKINPRNIGGCGIVIDTLTGPYRVDASLLPDISTRVLTLTATLINKIAKRYSCTCIATSQVHVNPETRAEEPPAYTLIQEYFDVVLKLQRIDSRRRLVIDEKGNVIAELLLTTNMVLIKC